MVNGLPNAKRLGPPSALYFPAPAQRPQAARPPMWADLRHRKADAGWLACVRGTEDRRRNSGDMSAPNLAVRHRL